MAKTKEAAPREGRTVVVKADRNAGDNGTVVLISDAGEGGHRASFIAITPDKRTQTVGEITWDGPTHTFELPYVAQQVRVMDWLSMGDADEIIVEPVGLYTPPEPPPDPIP
jgi:ABC-type nitrate/sulfonate/bicarbonate transport system ATPase subunit